MLGRIPVSYDVAILGSGFAGSILAAILARNGVAVLLIDAKSHPRFAVGESTIPQTSQLLSLLSREYDVPELSRVGLESPEGIRKNIGNTCGVKRTFGFAYHRFNEEHDPTDAIQFGNIWRDENHLFRQDIDSYLATAAVSYGTTFLQDTPIASIDISEERGVKIETTSGEHYESQYLVDGTGYRSILAAKYGLREEPTHFKHHSRSIFTHMIDVKPFEDCVENKLSNPWSKSTLHHVFERGWLWVIPFNNYEGSTNPLVSIGLTVDPRVYPSSDVTPQQEFVDFLEFLPSAAKQFEEAKVVRPWVKTGRLQYSSSRSVGPRSCLMSHAAGFIDPLFSRGLINSVEVIRALAKPLLAAHKDGDYSYERFAFIDDLQSSILDYADLLVNGSFISWSDFDVWNAWLRVWALGAGIAESNLGSYLFMGKWSKWKPVLNPIFSPFEDPGYRAYFEQNERVIGEFEKGSISAAETAKELFTILKNYDFRMPLRNESTSHEWAIKNPMSRDLFLGSEQLHLRWSRKQPDPALALPTGAIAK